MSVTCTTCVILEDAAFHPTSPPSTQSFFESLTPKMPAPSYSKKITALCVLTSNMIEFIFYVVILWELLKNNRTLSRICNSTTTNSSILRERTRINSITALGHFLSWAIEVTLFFVVNGIIAQRRENSDTIGVASWMMVMLIPSINFCIIPMTQILTSPELRSHVFSSITFECIICPCGNATAVEEGFELNVIYHPNNNNMPPPLQPDLHAQPLAQG